MFADLLNLPPHRSVLLRLSNATKSTHVLCAKVIFVYTFNLRPAAIMRSELSYPVSLVLLTIIIPLLFVAAQNENICAGQESGTRINDPSKCSAFFVCAENEVVNSGMCPQAQPNFNSNTLLCATAEEYPCSDDDDDGIAQTTTTETTDETGLSKKRIFLVVCMYKIYRIFT